MKPFFLRVVAPVALFVVAMALVFVAFGPWILEQRNITACTESGGRWDFAAATCQAVPPAP